MIFLPTCILLQSTQLLIRPAKHSALMMFEKKSVCIIIIMKAFLNEKHKGTWPKRHFPQFILKWKTVGSKDPHEDIAI